MGQKMMAGQGLSDRHDGLDRAAEAMRLVSSTPIELFVTGLSGQR